MITPGGICLWVSGAGLRFSEAQRVSPGLVIVVEHMTLWRVAGRRCVIVRAPATPGRAENGTGRRSF